MPSPDLQFRPQHDHGRLLISPTDVSSYVWSGQCDRFLRLRLYDKNRGDQPNVFKAFDCQPLTIAPLRSRQGAEFELTIGDRIPNLVHAEGKEKTPVLQTSALFLDACRTVAPGDHFTLYQVPLRATFPQWDIRGIADLVRVSRDLDGGLHVLVADIKASLRPRVEQRMQVAFYDRMITEILGGEGIPLASCDLGILYQGPLPDADIPNLEDRARLEADRLAAQERLNYLGDDAFLEVMADVAAYRHDVDRFVLGEDSIADRVTSADFADVSYHLNSKCNLCFFGEVCMKTARLDDDLCRIPFITADQRIALRSVGITSTAQLASLLEPTIGPRGNGANRVIMRPTAKSKPIVEELLQRRVIGSALDTLVWRAQRLNAGPRQDKPEPDSAEPTAIPTFMPRGLPSTLPACTPDQNPNLITIYLDVQSDPLTDRLWSVSALVAAAKKGVVSEKQSRSIVTLPIGPVETEEQERDLLMLLVAQLLDAIADLASPDANGANNAPIHFIFWSEQERSQLLSAFARHAATLIGGTLLQNYLHPAAKSEHPLLTILRDDVKRTQDLPLLCQSLQSVSTYLGFDWKDSRKKFRERLFDEGRWDDGVGDNGGWVSARPRFSSEIPAEYAYAAFGALEPAEGKTDPYKLYRNITRSDLETLLTRRVNALRHIAGCLRPDASIAKDPFTLPDPDEEAPAPRSFAQQLNDFVFIERIVQLGEWRQSHAQPAEERVLTGESITARYHDADQTPETRSRLGAYRAWSDRQDARLEKLRKTNPIATYKDLESTDDRRPDLENLIVKLKADAGAARIPTAAMLEIANIKNGSPVIWYPRWDGTFLLDDGTEWRCSPSAANLLRGPRAKLVEVAPDGTIELKLQGWRSAFSPWVFSGAPRAFIDGELYTIDEDPSSWPMWQQDKVLRRILGQDQNIVPERNRMLALLKPNEYACPPGLWPLEASAGLAAFVEGLEAFAAAGIHHPIAGPTLEYIQDYALDDILLIQGPPGTGKSYTTAFALLARMHGAISARIPCRIAIVANTHAAVDVLMNKILDAQRTLGRWRVQHPDMFDSLFDPDILNVKLFRLAAKTEESEGEDSISSEPLDDAIILLANATNTPKGTPLAHQIIADAGDYVIAGGTPGGIYDLTKDPKIKDLTRFDWLILDEASRMTLPEAVLAARALSDTGKVVVVGDHRQMQPIRSRAWEKDAVSAFESSQPYTSVFNAVQDILQTGVPVVRLKESFRVHATIAEFLREQIYSLDDIEYHSRRTELLVGPSGEEPEWVAAALSPDAPMVLIRHREGASQSRNDYEAALSAELLRALYARLGDLQEGFGVVVPHTAQRARLGKMLQEIVGGDATLQDQARKAVDTVERFQGGERDAIIISATESDPSYLRTNSGFLYDPTRLTVALSRAKKKLVLVASENVFDLFSPDEEVYANVQFWRSIPHRYCTRVLWSGMIDGHQVEILGNHADDVLVN